MASVTLFVIVVVVNFSCCQTE